MSGEPVKVRGRKNPIDILFNLDHPAELAELVEVEGDEEPALTDGEDADDDAPEDEVSEAGGKDIQARLSERTFVVASRTLAAQPNWVSVIKVCGGASDADILRRAGVKGFDDPRYERYVDRLTRLRKIRDYQYVMHVLNRDLSYEEVAEIFVRVNSLGVKLRSSDLALAQITAKWRKFLHLVEEFQEECEKQWFTLDTGLLVRTMIVFATKQAKFQRVGSLSLRDLEAGWEEAKKGLTFAINFLRANADIEDESLLSAPTLMVPVAVFSRLRKDAVSAEDERELLYWLHVANARGRYSRGSSETLLNEDLSILFRGGKPQDLLEPITRLFGRLHVLPTDLAGRPARSALFPLAYLAARARGAKDWESGLGIQLGAMGKQHVIQYHHIFPKAFLKAAGIEGSEVNEIANLGFINSRTNQRIGKRPPAEYLPEVVKRRGIGALEAQFIPTDPALWEVGRFKDFLEARRQLLADAINTHMESARGGVTVRSAPAEITTPGDNGSRVRRDSRGAIVNAAELTATDVVQQRVLCPACEQMVFATWPAGWDGHAASTCPGLPATSESERKAEFRRRFAHLFR
jgi:hypothetical protein